MVRERNLLSGKCDCKKCIANLKEELVKYKCVDCKRVRSGKYYRRGAHYPLCYTCTHPIDYDSTE